MGHLQRLLAWTSYLALFSSLIAVRASPYRADIAQWNLNVNQNAQDPTQFQATRSNTTYTPSPENWRALPVYTVLLDKMADGDPTNNEVYNNLWEHDWRETQLRFGGDLAGLSSKLDYFQGMGIKTIYIAGTIFINMPWQADSYSPLDFTVLDPHWGTIDDWVNFVDGVHARGMYLMLDFTVGTMADLVAFKGFENTSAPFTLDEYDTLYKHPNYAPWGFDEYIDFNLSNTRNSSCELPLFWDDSGANFTEASTKGGCLESDFDSYGDLEAFGVHPDWQRQLSKFASVQDRLREWKPSVQSKLQTFACMAITALDFDAIRIDKSTQVTLDALAEWTTAARNCASNLGKKNFLITGEVTGGNTFGALYVGRGRTPDQAPPDFATAANTTANQTQFFLREQGKNGLDGNAFHYSIYRGLTRFLGLDGNEEAGFDVVVNFIDAWNQIFTSNDFLNPGTGAIDPRHLFGTSNFDVFRWPSLVNGTQRAALASFITTMLMPGVALYFYGEEQDFYIYDNGASNYLFGRQAMPANTAWQRHGCYKLGSDQYFNFPLGKALTGCVDDWNSLDHYDPTAETRRLFSQFNQLRTAFPVIQDGFSVNQLANWTHYEFLPFSGGVGTELGLWSATRAGVTGMQNFTGDAATVWMLYTNENFTKTYSPGCSGSGFIQAPYVGGISVQNQFEPYENYTLQNSNISFFNDGEAPFFGCLPEITMDPYSFKMLVPQTSWVAPLPAITKFWPGHDARIVSDGGSGNSSITISFEFNQPMDCSSVSNSISLNMSSSGTGSAPTFDATQAQCGSMSGAGLVPGAATSQFFWNATLTDVPDGILTITVNNPSSSASTSTGAKDHFLLRKGTPDNVMVFPTADYDANALSVSNGQYTFTHKAIGAEKFRYTGNFGINWTDWTAYEATTNVDASLLTAKNNTWKGEHIIVQYWSAAAASAYTVLHSDTGFSGQRRVPAFNVRGSFNTFGLDKGIQSSMTLSSNGGWELPVMAAWPESLQINVFDKMTDYFYGDSDGDGVLDRLPPNSNAPNFMNLSIPPMPHVAWKLSVDDSTLVWSITPHGQAWVTIASYALLVSIPIITATAAVLIFMWSFYGIKYNQFGLKPNKRSRGLYSMLGMGNESEADFAAGKSKPKHKLFGREKMPKEIIGWPENPQKRRTVLIATLEYEIIDWKLKVKIGGLGVMSSLMGKAMSDVDLIWVVPKVKDIEYPPGEPAEPIEVIIFGEPYLVEVETHVVDNITYVIIDSPVFRAQTKSDPYPARMDDLSSAIFYSTWNQAIATTIRRFPQVDIYHINDYHGALAPIYLLPKVIPVCLSLHNAEFQGLWPLRTKEEMKEVCSAFNISKEHCIKYVQFGNTFNLLHAAASFISVHQKSIGVAGVSDKYGKRSWARYPALWTLKHVDSLPNPDPTDIAALDEHAVNVEDIKIDKEAEAKRPELKRQAQEWAKIKQDPKADLFVFVGRWSKQKGVDVIADVMPTLLEERKSIQLICVGPVIDLYGRFAAIKLARLMELYPDRVFSKPEFTALPPFIFSGADFALIPSRDEPFGLVAVEFGRKGALGVGSRLGGLGLMPGWWFPVESTSTEHMQSQFARTIKAALKSSEKERALLRARSAVQRFPVVEWRQKTEDFHRRSILTSRRIAAENAWRPSDGGSAPPRVMFDTENWDPVAKPELSRPNWDAQSAASGESPGITPPDTPNRNSMASFRTMVDDERRISMNADASPGASTDDFGALNKAGNRDSGYDNFLSRVNRRMAKDSSNVPDPFMQASTSSRPASMRPFSTYSHMSSVESIATIVDEKADSVLNFAESSFTDADGAVAKEFIEKLKNLNSSNTKSDLSVEKYLQKSEEHYFDKTKEEKLYAASIRSKRESFDGRPPSMLYDSEMGGYGSQSRLSVASMDSLQDDKAPQLSRLQIVMQRELGGWPLYCIIIAIGQILSATSFQLTLLSGNVTPSNAQLGEIAAVFFVASILWYVLFRFRPSVYVLAAPWIFFALAFFLIGLPLVSESTFKGAQPYLSAGATWLYAAASAAGFLFFGTNFGEEAGAATEVWMLRACIVQGTQQVWIAALWYWGFYLNNSSDRTPPWWVVILLWPLAALCIVFAICMYWGLPEYYLQVPPKVPNFYKTLFRRKLVVWFLFSEVLRDYWLSPLYGRNWGYLWAVPIPKYVIAIMVVVFFIGVWSIAIYILTQFAKIHTWLLAVFAVGLIAPRWAQMFWGTSSLGLYVPFGGKAGPYLGLSLWLWLGVLDSVQGVGLGIILLQTLSRLHVCATLAFTQILGTVVVVVARATAPDNVGPSSVFPDPATWDPSQGLKGSPIASPLFWVCLFCQVFIVVGYFWFYRKEQLSRP